MSDATAPAKTPPASPYSTRFKIVAALIVGLAGVLFAMAYSLADEADDDSITETGGTAEFVEALIPPDGSQILRQSTVGIDLAPGWQGLLRIGGIEIPASQLEGAEGSEEERAGYAALNRVEYTPGDGKVIEELPIGRLCIQALVWRSAVGRADSERTVSWCFEVV